MPCHIFSKISSLPNPPHTITVVQTLRIYRCIIATAMMFALQNFSKLHNDCTNSAVQLYIFYTFSCIHSTHSTLQYTIIVYRNAKCIQLNLYNYCFSKVSSLQQFKKFQNFQQSVYNHCTRQRQTTEIRLTLVLNAFCHFASFSLSICVSVYVCLAKLHFVWLS